MTWKMHALLCIYIHDNSQYGAYLWTSCGKRAIFGRYSTDNISALATMAACHGECGALE
jgi:hypothetical protein